MFIKGDLNGHIGKDGKRYEMVYRGNDYGEKNKSGYSILYFAMFFYLS